jgi:hypothetical protein
MNRSRVLIDAFHGWCEFLMNRRSRHPLAMALQPGTLDAVHKAALGLGAGSRVEASLADGSSVAFAVAPTVQALDEAECRILLRHAAIRLPPGSNLIAHFADGTTLAMPAPRAPTKLQHSTAVQQHQQPDAARKALQASQMQAPAS